MFQKTKNLQQKPHSLWRKVVRKGMSSRKPRRGTSGARVEQQSTEMLNFRCCCERCRLPRGAESSVRPGNDMKARKCAFTLAESGQRPHLNPGFGRCAFTLAETLIALAVIGIVAAMTVPSMVQNYKKKVVETRLVKFYSVINQAIQLSEIENGDKKNWDAMEHVTESQVISEGISAQDWYNKYLANYIKVIKTEQSGVVERKFNLYFADGSMVTFSGSSWVFYPYAKDYQESEVVKGEKSYIDRNRELTGVKAFDFNFSPTDTTNKYYYNKGVEPYLYRYTGTESELWNNSNIGCNKNAAIEAAYCTELIRRNGWKIPDNYPFRF